MPTIIPQIQLFDSQNIVKVRENINSKKWKIILYLRLARNYNLLEFYK